MVSGELERQLVGCLLHPEDLGSVFGTHTQKLSLGLCSSAASTGAAETDRSLAHWPGSLAFSESPRTGETISKAR